MLWARHWSQSILPMKTTRPKYNKNFSKSLWRDLLKEKCHSKKIQFFHMFYKQSAKQLKSWIKFLLKNKAKLFLWPNNKFNKLEPMMQDWEMNSWAISQRLTVHWETIKLLVRFWTDGDKTEIWFFCLVNKFLSNGFLILLFLMLLVSKKILIAD